MTLSFQQNSAIGASNLCHLEAQNGVTVIPVDPPKYEDRPHDTGALTKCYTSIMDAALSGKYRAVTFPTLGIAQGWPPQFAIPIALVAVERWKQAHPEGEVSVILCAPDECCYNLYDEFFVAAQSDTSSNRVVGFFHEYGSNGWFSNWYPAIFAVDGIVYQNAEQYLMHCKALCCGDKATAQKIMENPDPKTVKFLGRSIASYDDTLWSSVRQDVIYKGLIAKFSQNSGLRHQLLATGKAAIAECSPNDCIWGIGLALDDPRHQDISQWRGQNILGNTLMRVRDALQAEEQKC